VQRSSGENNHRSMDQTALRRTRAANVRPPRDAVDLRPGNTMEAVCVAGCTCVVLYNFSGLNNKCEAISNIR